MTVNLIVLHTYLFYSAFHYIQNSWSIGKEIMAQMQSNLIIILNTLLLKYL
jgi:hypothetical protein